MQQQDSRTRRAFVRTQVASVIALGVVLSACSGGGDGDNGQAVALKTKDDVARELSNLSQFIELGIGGVATASPDSVTLKRAATREAPAVKRMQTKSARIGTKAANTQPCGGSGTYSYEEFDGNYTYSYFDSTSRLTHISREIDDNCKYIDGEYSDTYNGKYEEGDTDADNNGVSFHYVQYGSGEQPAVETEDHASDSSYPRVYKYRGTVQHRSAENSSETRARDYSYQYSEPGYSASLVLGSGDTLKLVYSNSSTTIDGSVKYHTTACDGGTVKYETITPLSSSEGNTTGKFKLASGSGSATVTFNADGSASVSFADGSSATFTEEELQAAFSSPEC